MTSHTLHCATARTSFFPPFQQQHNLLLSWNEKFFNFTTLFSFVEQLFAQQQHQQRLKPAHLTAFTLRGFVHNWCHIIIVKTSKLLFFVFVDYTTTTTRATRIFFSHFQSDAHTLLRLYAQLQHTQKKHLQVLFFRDVAQIIFEFTLVVAGTSTTATTALEALITSKKLETQFSQGSLINDVTQWHISLRQQQQLEVGIFFHTDLIIWSYIRHYFNQLNNY